MLPEDKRAQLDAIVHKMVAAKESDANIQFVVDDFKKKYSAPAAPPAAADHRDFIQKASDFITGHNLPGAQLGKALGNSIGGIVESVKQHSLEPLLQAGDRNNANIGKVIGDTVQSAALPASLAVNAPASLLGRVAQGAGLGATLSGASSAAKGGDAGDIAKSAATGGAVGGALPLAGQGVRQLGKLLGRAGDKIQFSVIKPTQADIRDGFSIDTVKKFNLGGSLKSTFEKTDQKLDELGQQLNAKLASSNAALDLNRVYEGTAKRILGNKFEQFGSNSAVEKTLEQLRSEIAAVTGPNGVLSVPEAQTIKRAAGHFGAWTFGAPSIEATAQQKVYNAFYNEMKAAIEKASPEGVREINKQISELIPVMNALIRRIPVAERNSALSLTDVITMSAATLEPRALALTLANLASKSGRVGAALSKAGARVANPASGALGNALRTGITSQLGSSAQGERTQLRSAVSSPQSSTLPPGKRAAVMRGVEIGKRVDPTGTMGAVERTGAKLAGKALANIHPDDLYTVEQFISYARSNKGLPAKLAHEAEKLAERWGVNYHKGKGYLARQFESILASTDKKYSTVEQARDAVGRFKGLK